MESLNSNSQERELHPLQLMQDKTKESCMVSFRLLHSHLTALSNNDLKGTSIEGGFERAFATIFEQDVQTFTRIMFANLDQLEKHLSKEEFQELESSSAFRYLESLRESIQERAKHKREYDRRMNDRMIQSKEGNVDSSKALDDGLVVTESNKTESERHVSSSKFGKDTHAEDAVINSVDRNTTPDSTDMSHRGGEIDQNAVKCQVLCPLLDPSFDNMTIEFSNQSLESENISLKKTVAQVQKDFSRMEAHCVNMELKYQNQALKDRQHSQILNETSNKSKIKREIEVLEIINIELEHSVAKLFAENEKLHKENEHLEQTYKDLYYSIKKTRVQPKDHNDSLIAQINSEILENADLKAQIQEKVFANVALKNKLRKLKGNSVDTKFAKPSILGKPRICVCKTPHVIAPGSSRNSSKESYGSNDMAHNYYIEKDKKKTQDKNRNLKPREMPSANTHHTPNTYTPKPRSINHKSRNWPASKSNVETLKAVQKTDHSRNPSSFSYSKHFVCSTCQKCIFNANHDACITKFLKEVNSRAKIQPNKTRNSNKPVVPMSHTQKPGWKIVTGHSFSPNKSSAWVPTGKTFTSSTTKVDCEPPNGSNECITNSYDCDQTLNVSAGPALHEMTPTTISSGLMSNPPPLTPFVPPSRTDWDILFQPLFDELLTPPPSVDHPTPKFITPIAEVVAPEPPASTEVNHDLDIAHMNNDPFFGIPIPENDCEASSSSDVIPTVVQSAAPYSEHVTKWTKDYPLDNIIGELERPVSTRLQLHEQALFCYYDAFLLSVEPKTYKDALIMLD
ncbi:hypothetical protein Tco_0797200 [Tanacetum coccineum]